MKTWLGQDVVASLIEYRARRRPVTPVHFNGDELVKLAEDIRVSWTGVTYLSFPSTVAAVIISPDARQEARKIGGLVYLPAGRYGLKYVDMRQHPLNLSNVQARSSDAWLVSLSVELTWKVKDAILVANTNQPLQTLYNLGRAAVINFIQSQPHDGLVAAPEVRPMDESDIARGIIRRLHMNPALRGFDFLSINVLSRLGDPQRTEKINQARVQVEELKGKKEVVREEAAVAKEKETLAVQEARTSKMAALTEAEFEASIADIMRSVRLQNIEFHQLANSQQLNQEQKLKMMETSKEVLGQLAGLLSQVQMTPGLQHGLDNKAFEMVTRIMEALGRAVPASESMPQAPTSHPKEPPRILPVVDIKNQGE